MFQRYFCGAFWGSRFLETSGDWHYSVTAVYAQELSWIFLFASPYHFVTSGPDLNVTRLWEKMIHKDAS